MPSLFDTIQQNNQKAAADATSAPQQASEQNVTGQVQQLLQAKSGKAVAPSGGQPRASNIQEQQANKQGQVQGTQLSQQVQAGNQQLTTQVAQQGEQIAGVQAAQAQEAAKNETDYTRNVASVLNQYTQGTKKLDMEKDKAKFEQIGFQLRLADTQYVDTLNREGARARLNDDVAFRNEQARTVFSDELDAFHTNLDFRASIFADKEDFNEKMSTMNLDYAMQMATMANNQISATAMWTGVGEVTSGAVKAGQAYSDRQEKLNAGTAAASPTNAESSANQSLVNRGNSLNDNQSVGSPSRGFDPNAGGAEAPKGDGFEDIGNNF